MQAMSQADFDNNIYTHLSKIDLPKEQKNIVSSNLECACDDSEQYNASWKENKFGEGSAYLQNTFDTAIEMGYSREIAEDLAGLFYTIGKANGLRF
jgi:hypothetical protein